MHWIQKQLQLTPRPYGIHLITREVLLQLPELAQLQLGIAHFFLHHTSAGLSLNESVEPEVRSDLHAYLDRLVPQDTTAYTHHYEGLDDMPAHIKTVLVGSSVSVPITHGQLALGTWQGLYLCEFRQQAAARRLTVTLWGSSSYSLADSSAKE